jgi:cytochrome c biogenesis protein ResB
MKSLVDRVYDALRSIRLAIVLLVLLAVFSITGGIIPQGKTLDFYRQQFGDTG